MSLYRLIQRGVERIRGSFRSMTPSAEAVNRPLLSASQIANLAEEVSHWARPLPLNPLPSVALRQGEQTSRFMGSGVEYEESRPYQIGDEIRHINWRLMARTGEAYTKRFQEERQESAFILLDQRQTMRFGTHKRLKAEQALRTAGYYLWVMQQSGVPVEGARLAEKLVPTPTYSGKGTFEHLMEHFSLPCPPKTMTDNEPHLNDVLIEMLQRTQPGSRVFLISDFHDMNQQTPAVLTALRQHAEIRAVFIQDAAEWQLNLAEGTQLQSLSTGERLTLSARQSQQYSDWAEQYFEARMQWLQQSGVHVTVLRTDDPLSVLSREASRV